ncbi:MAG: hypothetical protein BGO10_07590 [Chlamydia sp. 32-24]|nr:MAG: hypothetical protein BGO10_07590 [Chlamydia sp. 32-24]
MKINNILVKLLAIPFLLFAGMSNAADTIAYVTDISNLQILPVDLDTQTSAVPINTTMRPYSLAITPDGLALIVAEQGFANDGSIEFLYPTDPLSNIDLNFGSLVPFAVAITPDGTRAFATAYNSTTSTALLIGLNVATRAVTGFFGMNNQSFGIAITPDGATAYVTQAGAIDGYSVANPGGPLTSITLPVGASPVGIAITPDGTYAYVTDSLNAAVYQVNLATSVVNTISLPVGTTPDRIAITPNGAVAYVANTSSNTAYAISIPSNTVTPITLASSQGGVAAHPNSQIVYFTDLANQRIAVVDVATNTLIGFIVIPNFPSAIAIAPDQAPTAAFTVVPAIAGMSTDFTSTSTSPVGSIASYTWDFGDGTIVTVTTPTISHVYATDGNYNVTLTVTNTQGTSTTQTFTGQTVSNNGGPSATTSQIVTILPVNAPMITFIFPSSGVAGTEVTINGVNLSTATSVTFGGVPAAFTVNGDGTLTAIAPPNLTGTVTVTVTTPFGTSLPNEFTEFTYVTVETVLPPIDLRGVQITNRFADQKQYINVLTWNPPSTGPRPTSYFVFRDASLQEFVGEVPAFDRLRIEDVNVRRGRTYTYYVVSVDQFGNVSEPAVITVKPSRR